MTIFRGTHVKGRAFYKVFGGTLVAAVLFTGCAAADQPTTAATEAAQKITSASEPTDPIKIALDWDANTNHIGIYVAEERGFFEEAGIEVEIVPYHGVGVPDLVSSGAADFGIADQTAVQIERSAGTDVTMIMAITQTETGRIIYSPDREDITRPADLTGKVFGGFDSPVYATIAQAVIEGDGGVPEFSEVTLNTSTYEALAKGDVDFTLSVATWEDLLAEMDGRPYGTFQYQDFGMPDVQTLGVIAADGFLATYPEKAAALTQALQRGYDFAVGNPQGAAGILLQAEPEVLEGLDDLVIASTELMARNYFVAAGRGVGELDPEIWGEYGAFLFERNLIADAEGNLLVKEPNWDDYFTNQFLDLN